MALHCLADAYDKGLLFLEEQIAIWLAEDPENWPVLRLVLLDPWSDSVHHWHQDAPAWFHVLGECAESAVEKFGPFGRQPPS